MYIITKRFILRRVGKEDSDAIYDYMSNKKTSLYIEQGCLNRTQLALFFEDNLKENAKCHVIEEIQTGKVVGHMMFYPCFGNHTNEIGWIINEKYQLRGYAFEASAALLSYGFNDLNVHRIIATCQPENKASYQLMEKLGMVREAHFRQCIPKIRWCVVG